MKKQAKELNINLLSAIPINIDEGKIANEGKPIVIENPKVDISIAILILLKK